MPYGYKEFRDKLTTPQQASADFILPFMNAAVKVAENDPGRFGVKSVKTKNPDKVLNNSIINNFARWVSAGQPDKFVDFMATKGGPVGKGWAPVPAPDDPDGLNKNWPKNVRGALYEMLGPKEYERWKKYNMVSMPWLRRA